MAVTKRSKRSANGGQLLLLAALLFGIVTMHTLGHPTGHSADHGSGSASASTSTSGRIEHRYEQAAGRHEMTAGGTASEMTAGTPEATPAHVAAASAPAGMGGMDPLSVCLAVLAALTLVLLLKAGLLRPGGFTAPARPLARLLDGLRPNPPPPRILLSRLSVLRI
ncbi:hypothetical protein ACFVXC_26580 [Streptomyces sp. NPDC058257]|uniref:hypothetical protein n=1 Tax=Streptomyces sp. NPDC058257 TaxID=3346409 RepID=UPI0036F14B20